MPVRTRRAMPALLAAAALLCAGTSSVLAQPERAPSRTPTAPSKPAKPAKPPKVITIEDGEAIEGGVPSGQIIPVDARGYSEFSSLIRVRRSFVDMILKDAENL
jgi:hypothetical protein